MSFFVCKGAPSYNLGVFVDTLNYLNNKVLYTGDTLSDPTCQMTMKFSAASINIDLKTDNINFACGFGHAVTAKGFYYRVKGRNPTKEEILKDIK
ncbi:MAG: hypothetical protein ABI388_01860 [Bacteroidia bacterium]